MATKAKARKCHICNRRPASTEQGYCLHCQAQLEAERRRKRPPKPFRYATYRGVVVAFYRNGGDKLIPKLSGLNPDKLPVRITINLDKFCPGLTREQVKKLKRQCLRFAK
jgi:hypothetical protein